MGLGKKESGKIKTPKIYLNKQTVPRSNTPEELACNQRTSHKGRLDRYHCRNPLWQMPALWKEITEKKEDFGHIGNNKTLLDLNKARCSTVLQSRFTGRNSQKKSSELSSCMKKSTPPVPGVNLLEKNLAHLEILPEAKPSTEKQLPITPRVAIAP